MYEQYEAQKKRDVELAYKKMIPEEKAALCQKMTKIDNECAQPSPTPMWLTHNYNIYFIEHRLQSVNNELIRCLLLARCFI